MTSKKKEIITICGSMKFEEKMKELALEFTLEGKIVFTPAFKSKTKTSFTDKEKQILDETHKKKIKLSDSIFVVNIDNYIGKSTKNEIEFAKNNNVVVDYLVNPDK